MVYIPPNQPNVGGNDSVTGPTPPSGPPHGAKGAGDAKTTDAIKALKDQRTSVDASKHDIDPTSKEVLSKFLKKHGGTPIDKVDPGRFAPVYGAPILKPGPGIIGGKGPTPIDAVPVYGAPILKDPTPIWGEHPDPIQGKGKHPRPIDAVPVYGAPILKDPTPIWGEPGAQPIPGPGKGKGGPSPNGAVPVYGAPILKPHGRLQPSDIRMVYGAPIMMRPPIIDGPGPRGGPVLQPSEVRQVYGSPITMRSKVLKDLGE